MRWRRLVGEKAGPIRTYRPTRLGELYPVRAATGRAISLSLTFCLLSFFLSASKTRNYDIS